jgi:integral membrane protein
MCFTDTILNRNNKDHALMGPAHASSGLAVFILTTVFIPPAATLLMGQFSWPVAVLGALACVAGALIPDFDNTNSTVKSATGALGAPLSGLFRVSSFIVQNARTKYDRSAEDVHRGFWHSLLGAAALGLVVFGVTSIRGKVHGLPFDSLGSLLAYVIAVYCAYIALVGLGSGSLPWLRKLGKSRVAEFLISAVAVGVIFSYLPAPVAGSYGWLAGSMAVGALTHILGDALTKQGVPLFAPVIKIKGKRWYNIRFAEFDASDETLNKVVNFTSIVVVVVAAGFVLFAKM